MKNFTVEKPKAAQFATQDKVLDNAVYDEADIKNQILDGKNLEKVSFIDSVINGGSWAAAEMTESLLRRTIIKGARMSGLIAHTLVAENVEFIGCKLDMVNFRGSKIKNVVFTDCVLAEADLQGSTLTNVRFNNCDINRLNVNSCTFNNVDMRSSKFVDLLGASALHNVTMSREQLIALAPILAQAIGIKVEDS